MSTHVRLLIPRKQAASTQTTQYTVTTGSLVVIDKFTATNTSDNSVTISVSLPAKNEAPGDQNTVTYSRSIASKEAYTFPELVGQVINAEGYISTIASAAGSITITASGREIS